MRISVATAFVLLMAALAGCRRDEPRTPEQVRNSPRSPREAQALMLDVDRKGAELGWPDEVLRNVRRRMKGRLGAAGLSDGQVEQWIASAALANQTKKTGEQERQP
jgi:hypothetical protein